MTKYAIKRLDRLNDETFKLEAENYLLAIEIFKGYGQYQANSKKIWYIYDIEFETFSDMIREDYYLITEF